MNRTLLLTLFATSSLLGGMAVAQSNDFARNKLEAPLVTKSGACVLTKWQGAGECGKPAPTPEVTPEIAPVALPAPEPVAAAPEPVPAAPPEIPYEKRVVYFDFDKAVLTPEAMQKLEALIVTMAGYTNITKVEVTGFADILGKGRKKAHNHKLSENRAYAVRDYIALRTNIPVEAMGVKAVGDSAPFAKCDRIKKRIKKIECLGPDRRVEIEFRYLK